MWSAALSRQLYDISEITGIHCHLNVFARAGRIPFKEVSKNLKSNQHMSESASVIVCLISAKGELWEFFKFN
jgi:hypothetical protein